MNKHFVILIDGQQIAEERRDTPREKRFVGVDYPIPPTLAKGKYQVRVRFEVKGTDALVYEARTMVPAAS